MSVRILPVRLRTQILIFLLVFGLVPLLAAVLINLPLVFGSLELFYHKAYLQNLRADFRDLDQHLASRQEMLRLLAKLPEPGSFPSETEDAPQRELARVRYTHWINQILAEQIDIIQLLFLDAKGQARFWLERDQDSQQWHPTAQPPERPPEDFIEMTPRLAPGDVLVSRIRLNPNLRSTDPRHLMTLYLISPALLPVEQRNGFIGSVVMGVDVGGLAKSYRHTLWVNDNGSYLDQPGQAFRDYPGLEHIFAQGSLDLWKGADDQQILWVPLLRTENAGPLWVGRRVDPSPLAAFRRALTLRVLWVIGGLIILVLGLARWIALRLEQFGQALTQGVSRLLHAEEPVRFAWNGAQEVIALGETLTALAQTHQDHARALRQHARELEASNHYKSEFLANVSHELRTPLNSILLLSKLLADETARLHPEQAQQARVIHQAGRDLQGLIDTILDHAKIEAGQTPVELEWLSLCPLLESLQELLRPQFIQKGLYLRLDLAQNVPLQLRSDGEKLCQIIKNFLSNAVKFTDHGGVVIRVERLASDLLAIRVQDTGIGIPSAHHRLIFEAFKQADGSTRRRHGGTGLGLSISQSLAQLLGGNIELRSQPGAGSTFSLLLPLDPTQSDTQSALPLFTSTTDTQTIPPAIIPNQDQRDTVLIVSADVDLLLNLTPLLESWELQVAVAADSQEARDWLLDGEPCRWIFWDMRLPETAGYVTINNLRALPAGAACLVIALLATAQAIPNGADAAISLAAIPTDLPGLLARTMRITPNNVLLPA